MKILSIGRGENCNIYLDDQNISRRHAQLRIYPTGRMEIVDYSQNGTFINNVRVQPNAPTPVTRRDVVSFAHTRLLDWKLVPDPLRPYRIGGMVVAAVCVVLLAWWGISSLIGAMRSTLDADAARVAAMDSVARSVERVEAPVVEPMVEPTPAPDTVATDTVKAPAPAPAPPVATPAPTVPPAVTKPKVTFPAKPKAAPKTTPKPANKQQQGGKAEAKPSSDGKHADGKATGDKAQTPTGEQGKTATPAPAAPARPDSVK